MPHRRSIQAQMSEHFLAIPTPCTFTGKQPIPRRLLPATSSAFNPQDCSSFHMSPLSRLPSSYGIVMMGVTTGRRDGFRGLGRVGCECRAHAAASLGAGRALLVDSGSMVRFLWHNRQCEDKCRPARLGSLQPNVSSVSERDLAADAQAQARADDIPGSASFRAIKPFENTAFAVLGNFLACVCDSEHR